MIIIFRSLIIASAIACGVVSESIAQAPACPQSDIKAAELIRAIDDFPDAHAREWAKCSNMAARIFAASVLGDGASVDENFEALLTLMDDTDPWVRAQAAGALTRHGDSRSLQILLAASREDTTPSRQPFLTKGDIVLAFVSSQDPRIDRRPHAIRSLAVEAEVALFEQIRGDGHIRASPSDAQRLLDLATTSPRPDLVFAIADRSRSEFAELYRHAAIASLDRMMHDYSDAQLAEILVQRVSNPDILENSSLVRVPVSRMLALARANGDFASGLSGWYKPEWSEADSAALDALALQHGRSLIREGEFVKADRAILAIIEVDGEVPALDLFIEGLARSYASANIVESATLEDAILAARTLTGLAGQIAAALDSCGQVTQKSEDELMTNISACGRATLLASGLPVREAIEGAVATGQVCRAVAMGIAGGEEGRQGVIAMWDALQASGRLGAYSAAQIENVYCEQKSNILRRAMETIDPARVAAADRAADRYAGPGTLRALLGNIESCREGLFWTEGAALPASALAELARDINCTRQATPNAYDAILSGFSAQVRNRVAPSPRQIGMEPYIGPGVNMYSPDVGPGTPTELPVIREMPMPYLNADLSIDALGGRNQTLGQLHARLREAFYKVDANFQTGLFSDGKGGFIVLARRERIDSSGKPFPPDLRFTSQGQPQQNIGTMFASILGERPGQFRVLAVVVSETLNVNPAVPATSLPLDAIGQVTFLPSALADKPVGAREVFGLVYVFERPKGKAFRAKVDGPVAGRSHFLESGVWGALGLQ